MKLRCLICGKSYYHLGSHIAHGHHMLAREYKETYGLPFKMALITQEIKEKKSEKFWENERKGGAGGTKNLTGEYQFGKGHSGLRRISEHERRVIIERIKKVNKTKTKLSPCPVCKMQFNHVESHLYNKHRLISVLNEKL